MFVDETKLKIASGKGGDGAVAFRHEKYMPKGGPSGGDGGDGGSVIFRATSHENTLLALRYKRLIKAENGENGKHKNMTGACGSDVYIDVPLGTLIYDDDTNVLLADLTKDKEERVILKGGRGGRGNQNFANSRNQAPNYAEAGERGKELFVRLELRVLADVGFVGYPSVGKSTLISAISKARPKIAEYHFTTLEPNLGLVEVKDGRSFVCADLPGLIEGASKGLGLGFEFLRHIERTKIILHILDGSDIEGKLLENYLSIRKELEEYDLNILKKTEIIVLNKMDSDNFKDNEHKFIEDYTKEFGVKPEYFAISAMNHTNLDNLLYRVADALEEENNKPQEIETVKAVKEYIFNPKDRGFEVLKNWEKMEYEVKGPKIDEIMRTYNPDSEDAILRVTRSLRKIGVEEELKKIGCKEGDLVLIGDIEFEFSE